ncbi:MAG: S46 family peptidase [Verrucomicrobiia bacterium]
MKTNGFRIAGASLMSALMLTTPFASNADEGMWLFNNPPKESIRQKYGFDLTEAWLEHVQKSSVRFNSGGSGSFVSPDGLVMSNHHVGADCLQKLSDSEHNYYRDGFRARSLEDEKRCHDLELNVLLNIQDVTERVNAAVKPGMSDQDAFLARRGAMAEIEKESLDKTGLRSDVVTLYQGGQYHLYRFKKYTDVRLVFAPEQGIAFFGGDPDNFEYPRYCLDICFFRAYENGKPAKVEHYLKWSEGGAAENELVFVSGHPGRTSRLFTVAELEYLRDFRLPSALRRLNDLEVTLAAFSARSEENARRAKDDLFGVQNARKAYTGEYAGILDPALLEKKQHEERQLRAEVASNPQLKEAADAWDRIAQAQRIIAEHAKTYNLLEGGQAFNSVLFDIGRTLLRAAEEKGKPNKDRLREFGEAGLESLEFRLFSEQPIYEDLEQLKLANSLTWLVSELGYQHPIVTKVLAGKSPTERATELVTGTRVKDVELRKKLYAGGEAAVKSVKEPMIELARSIDPEARSVRKVLEAQTEAKQQAHARIGKVRFAVQGTSTYPDATFTLRLAYGAVKGYREGGESIPFQTVFAGVYERAAEHNQRPPFELPPRWMERKDRLDLSTPFNFVCTADIIGGNSGSPVINRDAELVGIIFDGNIHSLVLDLVYTEEKARAVSVHSQGIMEALRKVYGAQDLADELTGTKR